MIALSVAAMLAAAQPPGEEPDPPPEVQSALQAWGDCVNRGIDDSDAGLSPRAAAAAVLRGCQSHQEDLLAAHGRWLDSSNLDEAGKRDARRSMEASLRELRGQVAEAIRMMRRN